MKQHKALASAARFCMILTSLMCGLEGSAARAAQMGAGTTAVFYNPGQNPPVWAKKPFEATQDCWCKYANPQSQTVTGYSDYSLDDARQWANAACTMRCLQAQQTPIWDSSIFGMWGTMPVTSTKPLGTVKAVGPGSFAAYLPSNNQAVTASGDPVALALQLMSQTRIAAVMLAGPAEYFAQTPQCLAP